MNKFKVLLLSSISIISFYSCDKNENKVVETITSTKDIIDTTGSVIPKKNKADTIQINNNINIVQNPVDEYGEEYDPYSEYYVIANEVYVRTKPNIESEKLKSLHFGDKVWSSYDMPVNSYKKIFFTKPVVGEPEPTPYYIADRTLVDSYLFNEYKTNFSLDPFNKLHTGVKKLILKNRYANNTNYELTQNRDRADNVIAIGDFDSDGIDDVAVLIDNVEKQSSRLLILCTNEATSQPYLAYANTYVDKLRVNSFKKGDKIFMEYNELEPSPIDGIIIQGEGSKGAIIYNKNNQKFETFGQLRNGY